MPKSKDFERLVPCTELNSFQPFHTLTHPGGQTPCSRAPITQKCNPHLPFLAAVLSHRVRGWLWWADLGWITGHSPTQLKRGEKYN